jgi:phosphoenolpyruvate carboxykinase (ATP)
LLSEKIRKHKANVWLVNTGWSGGSHGVGSRVKLRYTRAMIDAIYSGALADTPTKRDKTFGFEVITKCPDVPSTILDPRKSWEDKEKYDETARKLGDLFKANFAKYESGVSDAVRAAGPA